MFINYSANVINFNLVYAGAVGAGKATTLRGLYDLAEPAQRGKLIELDSKPSPTIFFDYRFGPKADPIAAVRPIGRFGVQARLTALPPPGYADSTRLLLHGVDGIVFVADSQKGRSEDNLAAWVNLQSLLSSLNLDPARIPTVLQFNKRDLPFKSVMNRSARAFSIDGGTIPYFGTAATRKVGLLEPLQRLLRDVLKTVQKYPDGIRQG